MQQLLVYLSLKHRYTPFFHKFVVFILIQNSKSVNLIIFIFDKFAVF